MPCFLRPIHESNDCHNPDGPGGGRFCSGPGAGAYAGSHLVRPGQSYDLPSVLTGTRLFLFNPSSGQMALGDAAQKDSTHAAVLDSAQHGAGLGMTGTEGGMNYDLFRIHGFFTVRNGKPEVQVVRIVASPDLADQDLMAMRVDQIDAIDELGPRLAAWGLPPETAFTVSGMGGKGLHGNTLGKAFPDAYKKRKRAA